MPKVTIVDAGQPVFNGTQYYWTMDEASGTTAQEYYANKDLTHNGTYVAGVNGKGTAIDFNGTNDYAYRTDSAFNVGTVSLSMAWWIKPGTYTITPNTSNIFNKATKLTSSNQLKGWTIQCWPSATNGEIGMLQSTGLSDQVGENVIVGPIPINTWTHLALCYNRTAQTFYAYRNGVYVTSGGCGNLNSDTTYTYRNCYFYSEYASTTYYYDCTLDDVWFFKDKVLAASEVLALYRNLA